MYILPCVLAILALMPAAPLSAAEPGLKVLAGVWRGSVTTTPDSCVWKVSVSIKEKLGYAHGGFSSTGPCAKGRKTGTFSARPAGPGCYKVDASMSGLPKVQLTACFDESGNLIFNSPLFNGALTFSENGREAALEVKSLLGSASGTFKKQLKVPAVRGGETEKKNVHSVKKHPVEVHGGGY